MAAIGIDGKPIEFRGKAAAYVCQFGIHLAADAGFRAPTGTSWLDLSFHERADGRILVSVPERNTFRAHGARGQNGLASGEVAQTASTVTRTYALEEMGLRSPNGKLTPQGSIFIELLRANGHVASGRSDLLVLQLANQLREWTGIAGEPLQLVDASREWKAVFTCTSEARRSRK
jgi:hypothetical protein